MVPERVQYHHRVKQNGSGDTDGGRQRDRDLLYRASAALAVALRGRFGRRAMGPVAPPVDRIREEYITEFLLKIESGASASRAREVLREVLRQTLGAKEFQTVTLSCDVDPQ